MSMPKENQTSRVKITVKNYERFIISEDGLLVDSHTGEIMTQIADIIDHYHLTMKLGKQYTENYYIHNWHKQHKFTKVYQVFTRNILEDITTNSKALLLVLISHLEYSTNEILIESNPPKNLELAKLCGCSERSLGRSLQELKLLGVIYFKGESKNRTIFLCPEVALNGQRLLKATRLLFE